MVPKQLVQLPILAMDDVFLWELRTVTFSLLLSAAIRNVGSDGIASRARARRRPLSE